jgi:hypothetical protein
MNLEELEEQKAEGRDDRYIHEMYLYIGVWVLWLGIWFGSPLGTRFRELIVGRWGCFLHRPYTAWWVGIGIALYFCGWIVRESS